MKERRVNQKRTLALHCLLAEQVSSQERLLWRGCPHCRRSGAARVRSLLASKAPYVIAVGSLVVGGILAVSAFFSSTARSISVDTALGSSVTWFVTTLVAGLLLYVAHDILPAARSIRPLWWRLLMASPFGLLAHRGMPGGGTTLVEPPPVPPFRGGEIYGLTDRRVIILEAGKRRSIRSLWLQDIEGVRCVNAGDGWGDLILETASSGTTIEVPGPGGSVQGAATRLFGIERAGHVEEALRCLLAHKPLRAAIEALTCQSDTPRAEGERWRGADLLPSACSSRAQQWQALLWYGPTPKELEATVVNGSSLTELRVRATERLLSQRPRCFSNSHPPQRGRLAHGRPDALYSCSESDRGAATIVAPVSLAAPTRDAAHPDGASQDRSQNGTRTRYRGRKGSRAAHSAGDTAQATQGEQAAPVPLPSTQEAQGEQPCQWVRRSATRDVLHPDTFLSFEDAVEHFVDHDLLPERGPGFVDELLAHGRQLLHVQTVRVVDDEQTANDMLHRGGWHVFHTMGMTAPRGQLGPVLFVLGVSEDHAM
jgi:hypothetical protein